MGQTQVGSSVGWAM